ncbi:UNVERIFIED_CONTAM: hypothetical protein GTU68_017303, partial [Idotea baltica]|nr:hypothetical protein [Idotea baltica]
FPRQLKSHLCGDVSAEDVGKCVTLRGFLQYQRMGIFCILRDSSGLVQVVVNTDTLSARLKGTPYESYIQVTGKVVLRPEEQKNETMRSGEVEVVAEDLLVVNEARRDLPFLIRSQNKPTESLGLKHRYLDLRQTHLQQNLRFRSKLGKKMRDLLQDEKGFLEVITPSLSVNTPGGSQEFVVPSRF